MAAIWISPKILNSYFGNKFVVGLVMMQSASLSAHLPSSSSVVPPTVSFFSSIGLNGRTHHLYHQADEILAFSLCARCEITDASLSIPLTLVFSTSLISLYLSPSHTYTRTEESSHTIQFNVCHISVL